MPGAISWVYNRAPSRCRATARFLIAAHQSRKPQAALKPPFKSLAKWSTPLHR